MFLPFHEDPESHYRFSINSLEVKERQKAALVWLLVLTVSRDHCLALTGGQLAYMT